MVMSAELLRHQRDDWLDELKGKMRIIAKI